MHIDVIRRPATSVMQAYVDPSTTLMLVFFILISFFGGLYLLTGVWDLL